VFFKTTEQNKITVPQHGEETAQYGGHLYFYLVTSLAVETYNVGMSSRPNSNCWKSKMSQYQPQGSAISASTVGTVFQSDNIWCRE
jgi:hypothetical protein